MNKFRKKLVSVVTACAMAVGVLAGAAVQPAGVKAASMEGVLTPTQITDFATLPTAATASVTLPGKTGNSGATTASTAKIVPISMGYRGVLSLAVAATGLSDSVDFALYSDQNCTMMVGTSDFLTTAYLSASKDYTVTTAGTYYLKLSWRYSVPDNSSVIGVAAYAYSGAEVTINDSYQAIYTGDSTLTNYHKLVLASDSLVTLFGNSYYTSDGSAASLSLNLCDSNKITLDDPYMYSSNMYCETYALKKGTYYVSTNTNSPYQLKATVTKVKDQSGASRSKAKLIKKKKTVKGMVALSEGTGKSDWFKVKLTKRSKLKLAWKARCTGSGSLKLQVIPANSNYRLYNDTVYMSNENGGVTSKTKLNKGTYYIKISKSYGDYSGSYSLKYVK